MLNGIEMYIIDMSHQVFFVTDSVFPKPLLPYTALPVFTSGLRDLGFFTSGIHPQFGKPALYAAPLFREITVIVGQFPNAVKMIRQKDNSRQIKWVVFLFFNN
jgi:hypothetical protein